MTSPLISTPQRAADSPTRRIAHALLVAAEPHEAAPRGRVTVSIGVASGDPAAGHAPDDLLGAADACLYAAKTAGRNQVSTRG
ncbi:diguanylate cyclase domain-containing protein [Winogradskya humida]|uniref:GGDEF domain-containing protein n=1 Tax=Winogradskya humida TaxID=113566 RepID=A0ABQ4A585_9ACTN|nr:GGDEF domain-containing protein [Actinoplanes humidus]GIE25994.1 hypothetical protein Ahu01nite_090960 [Actinoplanes humidus]